MVISAEPLIYGLIFIAVLALVQGIYLTVFGKSISLNNRVNRRLEMLEKGAGREQVLEQLRKEMSQHMNQGRYRFIRCWRTERKRRTSHLRPRS